MLPPDTNTDAAVSENEVYEFASFADLYAKVVSPPFPPYDDEMRKILGIKPHNSELEDKDSSVQFIDTEKIIEIAAEKFIQSMSTKNNKGLSHPYPSSILLCHNNYEDSKRVQLVQNLLSCAEKVGDKNYEGATMILDECRKMSSPTGTPIERIVFYFAEALQEKIDQETGGVNSRVKNVLFPLEELVRANNKFILRIYKRHPLFQIPRFSGTQAVVDHAGQARKIHIIDLEIRSGVQWTILMQALAARPAENPSQQQLKITAVGTGNTRSEIEETCGRLASFADSLSLNFSYHIVMVANILELQKDLFPLDVEEAVSVYADYNLTNMIGRPDQLEHLMRVIKTINPRAMIVTGLEANCNSPIFLERFVEAMFFYGAFFDSIGECMKDDEENRMDAESKILSSIIRNIVAAEGDERKVRHVSINVWRAFFGRFGLVETELSTSSVYQATLVQQSFPCGRSVTLGMNGKCLTVGWKGTPLAALSVWKFEKDEVDES